VSPNHLPYIVQVVEIGVVADLVATRVGLDGSVTIIQAKFRRPNVDPDKVPEWAIVTIL
jgi:hypothetical protein